MLERRRLTALRRAAAAQEMNRLVAQGELAQARAEEIAAKQGVECAEEEVRATSAFWSTCLAKSGVDVGAMQNLSAAIRVQQHAVDDATHVHRDTALLASRKHAEHSHLDAAVRITRRLIQRSLRRLRRTREEHTQSDHEQRTMRRWRAP